MADATEQQLREKIASQKAAIAELPSLRSIVDETGLTSPETKARAHQIKELSDNEEELELLLESRRVEAVVKLQDELHPPEDSGDCPICLETIKNVNNLTTKRFGCCGGWTCDKCFEECIANCEKKGIDDMYSNKCPLCRESLPANGEECGARVLEHSNKGKAWAQYLIGAWCLDAANSKKYGLSFDEKKCWELIEQAADQGDPDALFFTWTQYDDPSKYDDEDMNKLHCLKRAADLGLPLAQHNLAIHYMTLAASQGYSKSHGHLGNMFRYAKCGLTQSYILAKHYSGKSLEETVSIYNFSFASWYLEQDRYEEIVEIPGHSPIPKFLFWARTGVLEGNMPVKAKDDLTKCISNIEEQAKSRCENCRKEAGCSSFKRCVRCLGAWYCGKECQVQHWKAGHKIDCVKRK